MVSKFCCGTDTWSEFETKMPRTLKSNGFTLIELIVVIGITAMLTLVTLAAFRQGNKDKATQLASDLVLSAVRTAQNDSLNPQVLAASTCPDQTAAEYRANFNLVNPLSVSVLAYDSCGNPGITVQTFNLPSNTQLESGGLQLNGISVGTTGQLVIKFVPPFGRV